MRVLFLILSTLTALIAGAILSFMSFSFLPEQKKELVEIQQMSNEMGEMGITDLPSEVKDLPTVGFLSTLVYVGIVLIALVLVSLVLVYIKKNVSIVILATIAILLFFIYGTYKLFANPTTGVLIYAVPVLLFVLFAFLAQNANKKKLAN